MAAAPEVDPAVTGASDDGPVSSPSAANPPVSARSSPSPRAMGAKKAFTLEVSCDDDDGCNFGASLGTPGKGPVSPLAGPNSQRNSRSPAMHGFAADKRPTSPRPSSGSICRKPEELFMADRAVRETNLLTVLPTRELLLDDDGRVELDDSALLPATAYNQVVHDDQENTEGSNDPAIIAAEYEEWLMARQRKADLAKIRGELREAALLGKVAGGLDSLHAGHHAHGPEHLQHLPPGSEPPPTPICRRTNTRKGASGQDGATDESGDGATELRTSNAGDRYRSACQTLGLPASPLVYRTLRELDAGGEFALEDLAGRAYIGDRGAQALFVTLLEEDNDSIEGFGLRELRKLDFAGHGIGNGAAIALASLLPRCPGLRELNLSRNQISETGAQRLLQEVAVHPNLVRVSLEQNPAPSWIRVRMKQILEFRMQELEKPSSKGLRY
eukprot:gnl/TRDRNA2_/TRDRNA2_133736_c0_seq1.p1 gnl/TRDRNA2_/TRDRNA2_133736_c0~~gnl/TRDRNA2_/TRDRNA2_133736_c0_seq1.p1  ORF type:complete len:443 (+),score=71.41 gnl/TRDRNA2_/TRDRNA2_133736_c0_seq1:70-1398(+)